MTKADKLSLMSLIKVFREHMEIMTDALESTNHPVDGILCEHLSAMHTDLQKLEFRLKDN